MNSIQKQAVRLPLTNLFIALFFLLISLVTYSTAEARLNIARCTSSQVMVCTGKDVYGKQICSCVAGSTGGQCPAGTSYNNEVMDCIWNTNPQDTASIVSPVVVVEQGASGGCPTGFVEDTGGSCYSIPPASVMTGGATLDELELFYANVGEAQPFDAPSILDNTTGNNPYYPSGYDSQGCQVGVTTWGVNASGELDCIPIPAGFDPGLFNDANAGVGCPWRGNLREYENCLAANAGTEGGGGGVNNNGGGVNNNGGGVVNPATPGTPGAPGKIVNPLKSQTIEQFLLAIIDIVLIFLLPLIVFFIIYGGFLLTTARGDTGQIEKGRSTLTWAVIGGVIVLGARTIIKIIQGTVAGL